MKRWLKSFPAKGSNQNVAEIKKEIQKEITNIIEIKNASQTELPVFENKTNTLPILSDENILGDLLFYLRSQKMMSTLMMCRQIETIEVSDGVASLFSESGDLTELVVNEKYKSELDVFFKGKGLSFKIKEKNREIDPIETLREFFGDKLIVK